jgi:hypothetical protein
MTDDDFIFTEHHLDTKEDEMQDIKVNNFFEKKENHGFVKLEGLDIKKRHEDLKNVSEQSIIYCPFNSSFSDYDEDKPELFSWPEEVLS